MNFKKIIIIIFLLSLNNSHIYSMEPDVFVQSTVNRASNILSQNISKEKKIDQLKIIAKETVDIKGVGFYSLGSIRKSLDKKQKEKYLDLFENYFLKSFSSRLAEYTNPEINVIGKEILNKNYTIVNSLLVATSQRPEVKIDWRIYTKNPDNPLIRDLIIEGLSLARTQKEEFASVLSAKVVPECGGDTLWLSLSRAYETLPETIKSELQTMTAVHDMGSFRNNFATNEIEGSKIVAAHKEFGSAIHPIVQTHPVSGKNILFINESFTAHVVGLRTSESNRLLNYLFQCQIYPLPFFQERLEAFYNQ